jgi:CheY-like chemotaxis protein
VKSRPGHGTTFDLHFPRVVPASTSTVSEGGAAAEMRPMTVLLVEDDEQVRSVITRMLEMIGHRVLAAENGAAGLNVARGFTGRIDLLVTDVVMPWMNGRQLADRLRVIRPEIAVVFISGYTENLVLQRGLVKPGISLLKKPFNQKELAAALETAFRDNQATG